MIEILGPSVVKILQITIALLIAAQQSGDPMQLSSALQYSSQTMINVQAIVGSLETTPQLVSKVQENVSKVEPIIQKENILGGSFVEPIIPQERPKKVDIDFDGVTQEMVNYFYEPIEIICDTNTFKSTNAHSRITLPGVDYLVQCDIIKGEIALFPALDGSNWIPVNWLKENLIIPQTKEGLKSARDRYACEVSVRAMDSETLNKVQDKYDYCKSKYNL